MGRFQRALGLAVLLVGAVVLWGITATGVSAAQNQAETEEQVANGYVGAEMCMECHEEQGDTFTASSMGHAIDLRTPAADHGCESCHGPGERHVEEGDIELIQRFDVMSSTEISDTCTTCHNRGDHVYWDSSQHNGRDLTCTTCHSVHSWKSEEKQLVAATVTDTCSQCHQGTAAKMQRTQHMPVREGKLECTSCHNPHGSANVKMLRAGNSMSANDACTSCHAEKRGPFLWEHAPVEENCSSCHDPHGTSNDRLLVAKLPMLCQQCHAHTRHPARPYDALNGTTATQSYGRACMNCHQSLHGSNHPSGRFFLR